MREAKDIVSSFYSECLTVNDVSNPVAVMEDIFADNFVSIGSVDQADKATLIQKIQFFWKLVPDMAWSIQEIIEAGNQVIVRGIAKGAPVGDFMGIPTDGSKSFEIMSIDIHTVENSKITKVYHLEDWATAMRQLTS